MRSAGLVSVFIAILIATPAGVAAAADAPAAAPSASAASAAVPAIWPLSVVGNVDAGRRIFSAICVYCHHLDDTVSDVGAPGLKDAIDEHGAAWVAHWLADPQGFADSDATARAMIAANPYGLAMPAFPLMQDAQNRADVIAFLQALGGANGKSPPAQ